MRRIWLAVVLNSQSCRMRFCLTLLLAIAAASPPIDAQQARQLVMFLLDSSEKAEDLWEKFDAAHPDLAESIKKSDRDRRID
jgi:hypothetical protein